VSAAKRAYDILRGYVGREWDRIQGVEHELAEKELNEALQDPSYRSPSAYAGDRSEVYERSRDPVEAARKLLGVSASAGFAEIRKAFERLNRRSDPEKFPKGSREREQAAAIQKRVHWAYGVLTDSVDATEKRFKSLEID
jgi:hypothetical protein